VGKSRRLKLKPKTWEGGTSERGTKKRPCPSSQTKKGKKGEGRIEVGNDPPSEGEKIKLKTTRRFAKQGQGERGKSYLLLLQK